MARGRRSSLGGASSLPGRDALPTDPWCAYLSGSLSYPKSSAAAGRSERDLRFFAAACASERTRRSAARVAGAAASAVAWAASTTRSRTTGAAFRTFARTFGTTGTSRAAKRGAPARSARAMARACGDGRDRAGHRTSARSSRWAAVEVVCGCGCGGVAHARLSAAHLALASRRSDTARTRRGARRPVALREVARRADCRRSRARARARALQRALPSSTGMAARARTGDARAPARASTAVPLAYDRHVVQAMAAARAEREWAAPLRECWYSCRARRAAPRGGMGRYHAHAPRGRPPSRRACASSAPRSRWAGCRPAGFLSAGV